MNPEEKAPENVDLKLQRCGWMVQDRDFNFGKEPANTASRGRAMMQREALPQVVRVAKDNFTSDQHPDLRADFVIATAKRASATSKRSLAAEPAEKQDSPTQLNISEWWDAKLEGDARWRYGTPVCI